MSRPFFYCSELSRRAAEKSCGTASIGEVWLLLEYPYAWGVHALRDSALSESVKSHLEGLLTSIPRSRLLFIKQERSLKRERFNLFVVRTRESYPFVVRYELDQYESLREIDIAAAANGQAARAGGLVHEQPLYLICTHGRRDKCCAKFGYAVYKSVREEMDGAAWQSSHVGGDRFAANLICFPHGLFYSHVTEEGAHRIIREYAEGRMIPAGYRGRACYSFPVQAAEFFIRRESGLTALDALRYSGQERLGQASWRVSFRESPGGALHQALISSAPSEFQNYITCHSTEEKSVQQYQLDDYRLLD